MDVLVSSSQGTLLYDVRSFEIGRVTATRRDTFKISHCTACPPVSKKKGIYISNGWFSDSMLKLQGCMFQYFMILQKQLSYELSTTCFLAFYTYATWYWTNQTTPLENVPLKLESQIYKYHQRCNVKVDNPSWEKEHHLQECRLVGDMLVLWEGSSREGFYLQLL